MAEIILACCGIYCIKNKANGKKYIGSSQNIKTRIRDHLISLNNGSHHSITLQRAWVKYGRDSFDISIVEIVENPDSLLDREQFWIDREGCVGKSGYNISPTAGSPRGVKHTEETKLKFRLAKLGKKQSPEVIARRSAAMIGRKMSDEAIKKRVESRRAKGNYTLPADRIQKIVEKLKASDSYRFDEDAKKKISDSLTRTLKERRRLTLENMSEARAQEPLKSCVCCGRTLPISDFTIRSDTGKRRNQCVECKTFKSSEWRRNKKRQLELHEAA